MEVDANDALDQGQPLSLKRLDICFCDQEEFPSSLCQSIGSLLRQSHKLDELYLRNVKGNLPYDFLQDPVHCRKLALCKSDFDPRSIASLIQGDASGGKLKNLRFSNFKNISKVELLLQFVDLTLLDKFEIGHVDVFMDALCHHLGSNKGLKELTLCTGISGSVTNDDLSRLATSLTKNDKIQKLEIRTGRIGPDLGSQKELLNAMSTMPRLQSWYLYVRTWHHVQSSLRIEEWKKCILNQVLSNWSILSVDPPFKVGDDVEDALKLNRYWRSLFRRHDRIPIGIWALALSRIERVGLMFHVVREIPNLFQQASNAASEQEAYQVPSFAVPHHPHCPGCHKKQRRMEN